MGFFRDDLELSHEIGFGKLALERHKILGPILYAGICLNGQANRSTRMEARHFSRMNSWVAAAVNPDRSMFVPRRGRHRRSRRRASLFDLFVIYVVIMRFVTRRTPTLTAIGDAYAGTRAQTRSDRSVRNSRMLSAVPRQPTQPVN